MSLRPLAPVLLALGLAPASVSAEPLCRAAVELDPPRAWVGQQVIYRLRIERSTAVRGLRWERNLSFPSFRTEWLPGSIGRRVEGDAGTEQYEERRALFPARPGRVVVPGASILCRSSEGEESAAIPEAELLVMPAPDLGRPDDWTGVVGEIAVLAQLETDAIRVGESARLSVLVQGAANVWDAVVDPAPALRSQGVEVFESPTELARDAGRRVSLRRYWSFDVVPREAGTLELPPIRVPWLDPDSGAYRTASSEALRLAVAAPSTPAPPLPSRGVASSETPSTSVRPLIPIGAALVGAGMALAWWRRRAPRSPDSGSEIEAALAEAARAEQRGDVEGAAAALARAARSALRRRLPEARALATEELFERAVQDEERELVLLLQRLDRARFAREGGIGEIRDVRASLERATARRGAGSEPAG